MNKKNYYAGVGIAIGTAVAGAILMPIYVQTGNAVFIAFIGVGTIVGLIIGSGMDRQNK
jgi:hypothetical protein